MRPGNKYSIQDSDGFRLTLSYNYFKGHWEPEGSPINRACRSMGVCFTTNQLLDLQRLEFFKVTKISGDEE